MVCRERPLLMHAPASLGGTLPTNLTTPGTPFHWTRWPCRTDYISGDARWSCWPCFCDSLAYFLRVNLSHHQESPRQNQTKERPIHELFRRGIPEKKVSMWIVLVFLRKNTRIHKNGLKFCMNFSLLALSLVWFARATPDTTLSVKWRAPI